MLDDNCSTSDEPFISYCAIKLFILGHQKPESKGTSNRPNATWGSFATQISFWLARCISYVGFYKNKVEVTDVGTGIAPQWLHAQLPWGGFSCYLLMHDSLPVAALNDNF